MSTISPFYAEIILLAVDDEPGVEKTEDR